MGICWLSKLNVPVKNELKVFYVLLTKMSLSIYSTGFTFIFQQNKREFIMLLGRKRERQTDRQTERASVCVGCICVCGVYVCVCVCVCVCVFMREREGERDSLFLDIVLQHSFPLYYL